MGPNCRHSFPQRRVERVRQSNRDSGHIEIMLFLFCLGKRRIELTWLGLGLTGIAFVAAQEG